MTSALPAQVPTLSSTWHVYCLEAFNCRRTYVGSTINLDRRLAQHNGLLAGGAKATTRLGANSWRRMAHVSGFPDERAALQFEWRWKQLKRTLAACRSGNPLTRSMRALATLVQFERPTKSALPFAQYPKGLLLVPETEAAKLAWQAEHLEGVPWLRVTH